MIFFCSVNNAIGNLLESHLVCYMSLEKLGSPLGILSLANKII